MNYKLKAKILTGVVVVSIPAIIAFIVYFRMAICIIAVSAFILGALGAFVYGIYSEIKEYYELEDYKKKNPTHHP